MIHFIQRPSFKALIAFVLIIGLCFASTSQALINPNYTPVDLVRQARNILLLEVGPLDDSARLPARITGAAKGEAPDRITISLAGTAEGTRTELADAVGRGPTEAMIFAGDFSDAAEAGGVGPQRSPVAMLHLDVNWFALYEGEGGALIVGEDPVDLTAVWAGSQSMLRRLVADVIADPRTEVPPLVGSQWKSDEKIGAFGEQAVGLSAVDLLQDGRSWLLVLRGNEGDQLLVRNAEGAWQNKTRDMLLLSRSRAVVWLDFYGDGRLELISWDGSSVRIYARRNNDKFADVEGIFPDLSIKQDFAGLSAWRDGNGVSIVLAQRRNPPVLLRKDAEGAWQTSSLSSERKIEHGGPVLAADITGNGLIDLVQAYASGVRLFPGQAGGGFGQPIHSEVRLGENITSTVAGDFDQDGRLDLLVGSSAGITMLTYEGEGRFVDRTREIGEPAYLAQQNPTAVVTLDVNTDGRQDFAMLYAGMGPHFYFNRGYRCFGYSIALELADSELEAAEVLMDGQRGIAVADFSGDGRDDVVFLTPEGDVWAMYLTNDTGTPLPLTVALPASLPGPVVIEAREGRRSLGARLLRHGEPVKFGKSMRGPLQLSWRLPGGESQSQQVIVLRPQRFVIPEP